MAAVKKKKKANKIKFELSLPAIGGIAVVCFCIFLWMYLLGIWTGQSLLQKSYGESGMDAIDPSAARSLQPVLEISPSKKKEVIR